MLRTADFERRKVCATPLIPLAYGITCRFQQLRLVAALALIVALRGITHDHNPSDRGYLLVKVRKTQAVVPNDADSSLYSGL